MSTSSFQSSTQAFQDFLGKFHSRKLFIHNPLNNLPVPVAAPEAAVSSQSSLEKNVLIVLSVLVCTIICTLILNFVIRCALCSLRKLLSSSADSSDRTAPSKPSNKGIEKKALKAFQIIKYVVDDDQLKVPGLDSECIICLSEFAIGERIRILPKCNHGFHVRCIDKWLTSNSSCPKCRHCLIEKSSSSLTPTLPVLEAVVRILPLEAEGVVRKYEG